MDLNDCLVFANKFPLCAFATSAGSQPRVRTMLLWIVDKDSLYFHTTASSQLSKEVAKNPKVEICFTAPPAPPNLARMMRVTGFCERVHNAALKARLLRDRPSLAGVGIKGPEDPELVILRIHSGEIRLMTMETFLVEKDCAPVMF